MSATAFQRLRREKAKELTKKEVKSEPIKAEDTKKKKSTKGAE